MAEPEQVSRWVKALWPIADRAGPALTLALLVAMLISTWWLTGWMRECVDRNRALTEKLLAQQQAFYQELRLALAHCEKP